MLQSSVTVANLPQLWWSRYRYNIKELIRQNLIQVININIWLHVRYANYWIIRFNVKTVPLITGQVKNVKLGWLRSHTLSINSRSDYADLIIFFIFNLVSLIN